jgi:hypothetical protein
MFEVEKPRRFHYEPRFYDPEKEKWEALKKKYAIEQERKEAQEGKMAGSEGKMAGDDDLQYFEQRLKDLDKEERANASKLTWRDLFRKREMPRFHYQPRFVDGIDTKATTESGKEQLPQNDDESLADKYRAARHQIKIKRRFDISDSEYMKPISGTKIILYCFIVFLLISLIIAF